MLKRVILPLFVIYLVVHYFIDLFCDYSSIGEITLFSFLFLGGVITLIFWFLYCQRIIFDKNNWKERYESEWRFGSYSIIVFNIILFILLKAYYSDKITQEVTLISEDTRYELMNEWNEKHDSRLTSNYTIVYDQLYWGIEKTDSIKKVLMGNPFLKSGDYFKLTTKLNNLSHDVYGDEKFIDSMICIEKANIVLRQKELNKTIRIKDSIKNIREHKLFMLNKIICK